MQRLTADQVAKREEGARKRIAESCVSMNDIGDLLASWERGRAKHIDELYDKLQETYLAYIQMKGNQNAEAAVVTAYWELRPQSKGRCNVHLMQMLVELRLDDCGDQADRYARTLRYALFKETRPDDLKGFLEDNGGISGCVKAHSELTKVPEDQRGNASKTKKTKLVVQTSVREAIATFNLPLNTDVPCIVMLRRDSEDCVAMTEIVTTPQ
ncbi:hypothetical protein D3093_17370 (plasmid) [Azospirillum argentinense]|uniref:Uncharacterized protein n=2 Tax=Azospirillum argentinense TaxID=2970906 RepID=A0A4D8PEJ8_9PROT|nr:hypothetical protein D3093_17370 [Azospirillum argentinense]